MMMTTDQPVYSRLLNLWKATPVLEHVLFRAKIYQIFKHLNLQGPLVSPSVTSRQHASEQNMFLVKFIHKCA